MFWTAQGNWRTTALQGFLVHNTCGDDTRLWSRVDDFGTFVRRIRDLSRRSLRSRISP